MSKVNVVIIPDGGNPTLVSSYFTNPLFNIVRTPIVHDMTNEVELVELALQENANIHTIIIKDTSLTNLTSDQIAAHINEALTIPTDLYYLARWDDQCQMSKYIKDHPSFLRTYAPKGFQAVMFYPSSTVKIIEALKQQDTINSMERILYSLIYMGVLTAICNPQNIFIYNAFSYANTNNLFYRLNTCSLTSPPPQVSETNKYLYIGGILILIFLVAWGMRKIGPKSQPSEEKKSDDLVKTLTK